MTVYSHFVIARELMWYNDFGQKENDKKNRIK